MKRSKELKAMARIQLAGKFGTYIGAYALYFMISGVLSSLLGFFLVGTTTNATMNGLPFHSIPQMILYFIVSLIISLILSVFALGFNKMFLDGSRGYPVRFDDLFYGFRHHPDRVILLQFLIMLISLVCVAPGYILILCTVLMELSFPVMIAGIILLIIGCIAVIYFSLSFSLCMFLLADYDDLSAMQALKESRKLMTGNKWRYFVLQLSFMGLLLLGVLSCYLGLLWILPYMTMTQTNFYRNITQEI